MSNHHAFNTPSTGTAGGDEMGRIRDQAPAQRDDAEATSPDDVRTRLRAVEANLPDGFKYDYRPDGSLFIAPTQSYKAEVEESAASILDARTDREASLDASDLRAGLDATYEALEDVGGQFAANGFLYGLARSSAQDFAGAVRWLDIHASIIARHRENGNEDGAEDSLLRFEESRDQAFAHAAILDWLDDQGIEVSLARSVDQALSLAAWQLLNSDRPKANQAAKQTTAELLFGAATA